MHHYDVELRVMTKEFLDFKSTNNSLEDVEENSSK